MYSIFQRSDPQPPLPFSLHLTLSSSPLGHNMELLNKNNLKQKKTRLKNINFNHCRITDAGVANLCVKCPLLEKISFAACQSLGITRMPRVLLSPSAPT
jgi:hypothetical protein